MIGAPAHATRACAREVAGVATADGSVRKHCGRAGRYEITVPDNKVRLDAIQALLQ
jgi:hypothetical protein